tara:strand:+ start:3185 stop:3472 length:288 start_codon:yes stop_codon:yes gene_type:complete
MCVAKHITACHLLTYSFEAVLKLRHDSAIPTAVPILSGCDEWAVVVGAAKVTTVLLDRLTPRSRNLEPGNVSYRFKASAEIAKQKRKGAPALTTT